MWREGSARGVSWGRRGGEPPKLEARWRACFFLSTTSDELARWADAKRLESGSWDENGTRLEPAMRRNETP